MPHACRLCKVCELQDCICIRSHCISLAVLLLLQCVVLEMAMWYSAVVASELVKKTVILFGDVDRRLTPGGCG